MGRGGKDKPQTKARDDKTEQAFMISSLSTSWLDVVVCERNMTKRMLWRKTISASSGAFKFSGQLMSGVSRGMLERDMLLYKRVIDKSSSIGALTRATMSLRYWLYPLNSKRVKAGKSKRVDGSGRWLDADWSSCWSGETK